MERRETEFWSIVLYVSIICQYHSELITWLYIVVWDRILVSILRLATRSHASKYNYNGATLWNSLANPHYLPRVKGFSAIRYRCHKPYPVNIWRKYGLTPNSLLLYLYLLSNYLPSFKRRAKLLLDSHYTASHGYMLPRLVIMSL